MQSGCPQRQRIGRHAIPRELALVRSDVCRLVLHNAAVSAEFTLDFCIALDEDLMGIEKQFEKIAANRRLDIRAIERIHFRRVGIRLGYRLHRRYLHLPVRRTCEGKGARLFVAVRFVYWQVQ